MFCQYQKERHNFNPDPHVAIVLTFLALPFAYSLVFWSASKSLNRFGAVSASALTFVVMEYCHQIFLHQKIFSCFCQCTLFSCSNISADYIFYKNSNKFIQKHKNKIAGSILGSVFFMFSFPHAWNDIFEIYVFNDVFPYDVLHTSTDLLTNIWVMSIVPGAIAGSLGITFASGKLDRVVSNLNQV